MADHPLDDHPGFALAKWQSYIGAGVGAISGAAALFETHSLIVSGAEHVAPAPIASALLVLVPFTICLAGFLHAGAHHLIFSKSGQVDPLATAKQFWEDAERGAAVREVEAQAAAIEAARNAANKAAGAFGVAVAGDAARGKAAMFAETQPAINTEAIT